ncbi:hypothetical protein A0H81_02888, partial [Grifola frondosa]
MTEFVVPNDLCSSITEFKHIEAVKDPWWHSNKYKAMGQILLRNQHHAKLATSHIDFADRGMFAWPCLLEEYLKLQTKLPCTAVALENYIKQPRLKELICRFLYDQLNLNSALPELEFFFSAASTYYAPNDPSGIGWMHHEHLHVMPIFHGIVYPCALVHWFKCIAEKPNKDTGMYIESKHGAPILSVLHLNTIVHVTHLIDVYEIQTVPHNLTEHHALDAYKHFYVNRFADHHMFNGQ